MTPEIPLDPSRPGGWRAWAITLGAVVLWSAGHAVPVPGLDAGLPPGVADGLAGLLNGPLVSVLGGHAFWLLAVWAGVRLAAPVNGEPSRIAHLVGAAVYLLVALYVGWRMAGSFASAFPTDLWFDLPPVHPGLVALTYAGGAVVTFLLAELVTRYGIAQGPVVLAGVAALGHLTDDLLYSGAQLGQGLAEPGWAALALLPLIPILVVLGALGSGRPRWPVSLLRGLQVTSGPGATLLPAGLFGLWSTGYGLAALAAPDDLGSTVGTFGGLAVSLAVAIWVALAVRRASVPGLRAAPLVLGALLPVGALGALALVTLGVSDMRPPFLQPGPYDGDGAYRAVLGGPGADAAADGAVIRERAESLGVHLEVLEAAPGRLVLSLQDVRRPEALLEELTDPRALAVHGVAEQQLVASGELPEGVRREPGYEIPELVADGPEPLASLLEAAAGRSAVQCVDARGQRQCRPWLLETEPIVTHAHIVAAAVDASDYGPYVSIALDAEGARRFEAGTTRLVGRKLAILLGDEILSVPVVMEPIPGGRLQLTVSHTGSIETALAEARRLARLVGSEPLTGRWDIASLETVDPAARGK